MMFLADAAPSPTPTFMGNLMLALVALSSIASMIVSLFALRRQPPLAEEVARDFVRRTEWQHGHDVIHERIDDTHSRINDLKDTTTNGFTAVERALGRIEGRLGTNTRKS